MTVDIKITVRPARFEDEGAIGEIHKRNGMDPVTASWRARWESYPFAQEFREIPIGWVLEADDGMLVGSLGNVHMLYEFGGQHLKAAIASSWAVDQPHRGKAMQLITAFYRQKGIDLWINGSANTTTAKVLTALKIPRIPIPDYAMPCFWATSPIAFARAALARRSTPGAGMLAYPAGMALYLRDVVCRSGRGKPSSTLSTISSFDNRFDGLWDRIASGRPRLRAVRTRAVLAWRFEADLSRKRARVVTAEKAGELRGYAVLIERQGSEMGMDMFDVADLQAAGDDPAIIRDLLLGCLEFARKHGADAIKFTTGTPAKRGPAIAMRPYSYKMPLWQLYFKAGSDINAKLATAEAWDFSLFDTY